MKKHYVAKSICDDLINGISRKAMGNGIEGHAPNSLDCDNLEMSAHRRHYRLDAALRSHRRHALICI
jgi:hypothetical protein